MKASKPYEIYNLNDLLRISNLSSGQLGLALCHSAVPYCVAETSSTEELVDASTFGVQHDDNFRGWGATPGAVISQRQISIQYIYSLIRIKAEKSKYLEARRNRSLPFIRLSIPWKIAVWTKGGISQELEEKEKNSILKLTIESHGECWIETIPPHSDGFSIGVELIGLSLEDVAIGRYNEIPLREKFQLTTKDFHSAAIGEHTAIIRGGCRGRISEVEPAAKDLLLAHGYQRLERAHSKFYKNGCPGRQSLWVSLPEEKKPALYVSCERGPGARYKNQLFIYEENGFVDFAANYKVDFDRFGRVSFIDWFGDGAPVLMYLRENRVLELYYCIDNAYSLFFKETIDGLKPKESAQVLPLQYLGSKCPSLLIIGQNSVKILVNSEEGPYLLSGEQVGLSNVTAMVTLRDTNGTRTLDLVSADGRCWFHKEGGVFEEGLWLEEVANKKIIDSRVISSASVSHDYLLVAIKEKPLKGWSRILRAIKRIYGLLPISCLIEKGLVERPEKWHLYVLKDPVFPSHCSVKSVMIEVTSERNTWLAAALWHLALADGTVLWPESFEGSRFSQGTRVVQVALRPAEVVVGKIRVGDRVLHYLHLSYDEVRSNGGYYKVSVSA